MGIQVAAGNGQQAEDGSQRSEVREETTDDRWLNCGLGISDFGFGIAEDSSSKFQVPS